MRFENALLNLSDKAIQIMMDLGAEYADVRSEQSISTAIRISNDTVEQASTGVNCAFGARAIVNGAWGFSSANSLKAKDVKACSTEAFKTARSVSKAAKEKAVLCPTKTAKDHVKVRVDEPLAETEISKKINEALHFSKAARNHDKRIGAYVVYEDSAGQQVTANSDGSRILTDNSRIYLGLFAIASVGGKVTSCREQIGICGGFELFKDSKIDEIAKATATKAANLLKAKHFPKGRFTVILDPKLAGVFAHEAVGHACEADYVVSDESILREELGKVIGAKAVSIIDNPIVSNGWGSKKYDDECVPTQKRVLISNGVLTDLINNRETAAKLGIKPNGGARAQTSFYCPIVRMSNIEIVKGDHSFEELLETVRFGLYLRGTRGGQVNTAKGEFQFTAEEAYLIEKGALSTPLLNVSLSGSTIGTLQSIDAVGNDLESHIGFCGKSGQNVPVGMASPHVRLKKAVIGA
jgi:TldD protein